MCKVMEELINNEKRECALRMLADRELPLEKIAKYSNLTLEQVKELSQLKEDAFIIFMGKMDFAEKSIAEHGYYTEQQVEKELGAV